MGVLSQIIQVFVNYKHQNKNETSLGLDNVYATFGAGLRSC